MNWSWSWFVAKTAIFYVVVIICVVIAVTCTLPLHWLVLITAAIAYFTGSTLTYLETGSTLYRLDAALDAAIWKSQEKIADES